MPGWAERGVRGRPGGVCRRADLLIGAWWRCGRWPWPAPCST